MKSLLLFIIVSLMLNLPANAANRTMCASGCDYTNLAAAFSGMSSGDVLTISNGTYSGTSNNISSSQKPPDGPSTGSGDDRFTVIKGATVGGVKISSSFDCYTTPTSMSWIKFENIEWTGENGPILSGLSSANRSIHHVVFKSCGSNGEFSTSNSQYMLFEDCYITGNANYNFITYDGDHNIFRRCIARKDATSGTMPMSHFMSYGSQYTEFQNCIAIDSDSSYYTNSNATLLGGFYIRKYHDETGNYSSNNAMRGCILLNVKHKADYEGFAHSVGSGASDFTATDCVWWDMDNCYVPDNGGVSGAAYSHNTWGKTTAHSSWPWNSSFVGGQSGYGTVANSIAVRAGDYAFYSIQSYTYNAFYNNTDGNVQSGSNGGGNITNVDPETNHLKYLIKVEDYAGLDGNDGRKMGAEILWKTGVDGTFHGDTGYATVRNSTNGYGGASDKLWPWPNEAVIRTFFINNSPETTPSPTRGFCASNRTLTDYICNYLGASPAIGVSGGVTSTADVDAYLYGEGEGASTPTISGATIPGGVRINQ